MKIVHHQSKEFLELGKECLQLRHTPSEILTYYNMDKTMVHLLVGLIIDKDEEISQHFVDIKLDNNGKNFVNIDLKIS